MALADDVTQYTNDDWKALYGIPEPRYEDFEDSEEYAVSWNDWFEGYSAFIGQMTQAQYARQAEEEQAPAAPAETTPAKPIESAASNDGNRNQTVENNTPSKYPVGSYVDSSGAVWSPDGSLLSPLSSPGMSLASSPVEDSMLSSDSLADPDESPAHEDPGTPAVADTPVWYVEDLRSTDAPATAMEGLKALVTSVFGEYTPVTTTSIITETVGNDTHQYLVETVAPGASGVDYEWVAGVFLFGIMLFCLMKLLGGVLK